MKITIDKEYTTIEQAPAIKEAIKEFKSRYTDNDLVQAYRSQTGEESKIWTMEALEITGTAFPAGWKYDNVPAFCFTGIMVERYAGIISKFATIRFYCNMELEINLEQLPTGGHMYETKIFTR